MLLNVEKWSTYEKLRAEIENITRAQIAANSSTSPMDLGAFNAQQTKGNNGTGMGRGGADQGKTNPAAGVTCHICKEVGHFARDCWSRDKGKGQQQGKGNEGKARTKAYQRVAKEAKKRTHQSPNAGDAGEKGIGQLKDCRAPLSAVDASDAQPAGSGSAPPMSGLYLAALSVASNTGQAKGHRLWSSGLGCATRCNSILHCHEGRPVWSHLRVCHWREDLRRRSCALRMQDRREREAHESAEDKREEALGFTLTAELVETGHRVVFEQEYGVDRSHMEHKVTKESLERYPFRFTNRVWDLAPDLQLEILPVETPLE
eukprot:1033424-Amphidinium_carterae.3